MASSGVTDQTRTNESAQSFGSDHSRTFPAEGVHGNRARDDGRTIENTTGLETSLALNNMRGVVILIVMGFHSVLAYLAFLGPAGFSFNRAPYEWRAFPIVDSHRWLGFDVLCASQDVYLMALMFFLSALFTWPSLSRKGTRKFVTDRLLRLGVPFAFALTVVVPLALYPVYRVSAVDPSPAAYAHHYLALTFWPNGPMWFLWQLLVLTIAAAGLHRIAPRSIEFLGRLSSSANTRPGRYLAGLVIVSALAYVPLALVFGPFSWSDRGPFSLQLSRPLLDAVFYFAGLGIGAYGLDRGLLAAKGMLACHWKIWLALALAFLVLWMGLTSVVLSDAASAPLVLRLSVDICFAAACATGCFLMLSVCLRFGAVHSRIFGNLSKNAFGLYLFHYIFVVWLQYALLSVALFAIAKAAFVFGGTLLLALATTNAMRFSRVGSLLIGEQSLVSNSTPPPVLVFESENNICNPETAGRTLPDTGWPPARPKAKCP
jgi:peptidoglycan/LPS O-acetylase OafA/YrhL